MVSSRTKNGDFDSLPTSPNITRLLLCAAPIRKKLRIVVLVSKAAFQFISRVQPSDYVILEEVKAVGLQLWADELGSIVEGHDVKKLKFHEADGNCNG